MSRGSSLKSVVSADSTAEPSTTNVSGWFKEPRTIRILFFHARSVKPPRAAMTPRVDVAGVWGTTPGVRTSPST